MKMKEELGGDMQFKVSLYKLYIQLSYVITSCLEIRITVDEGLVYVTKNHKPKKLPPNESGRLVERTVQCYL